MGHVPSQTKKTPRHHEHMTPQRGTYAGRTDASQRGMKAGSLSRSWVLLHELANPVHTGGGNGSVVLQPAVNGLLGHSALFSKPRPVFVQGFQPACDFVFEIFLDWPDDKPWKMLNQYVAGGLGRRQGRLLGFFTWGNFHC